MKLVDSGQVVQVSRRGGEYDGGPGCTCPLPTVGRALTAAASYSIVQAAQLNDKFKGLVVISGPLLNGLEKAAQGSTNADLLEIFEAAKETNQNYMQPENKVAGGMPRCKIRSKSLILERRMPLSMPGPNHPG